MCNGNFPVCVYDTMFLSGHFSLCGTNTVKSNLLSSNQIAIDFNY